MATGMVCAFKLFVHFFSVVLQRLKFSYCFFSDYKDLSDKKHKEKEKIKHKDGSTDKYKDKHKEKRKEEKVNYDGDNGRMWFCMRCFV